MLKYFMGYFQSDEEHVPVLLKEVIQGAWVPQSVIGPTHGFGSGHNLKMVRLSPASGLHWVWSRLEVLSFPLCLPLPLTQHM